MRLCGIFHLCSREPRHLRHYLIWARPMGRGYQEQEAEGGGPDASPCLLPSPSGGEPMGAVPAPLCRQGNLSPETAGGLLRITQQVRGTTQACLSRG